MFSQKQIEEIVELLITLNGNTKLYFGCDSTVQKINGRKYGKYATVLVIHKNGKNGCKIFTHKSSEPDYDLKKSRPKMRMMNEVQKVCQLYVQLAPFIDEFECEIHLDISTDKKNGSSCAAQEAAGYVMGLTGKEPKLKPNSFASSFGADHFAR